MSRERRRSGDRRAIRATVALTAVAVAASLVMIGTSTAEAKGKKDKYYAVVAHRGDANAAPENTVAAFRKAVAKGTDLIEFDVQFSSSGYPVVMHDTTLDRTTNCSGKVTAKSRTQLRACDAGSWFGKKFKGERIPTLQDALAVVAPAKWARVMLHMKYTPDETQAERTMDIVRQYGMANRVIVLASNPTTFEMMEGAGAQTFAYIFNSPAGWTENYEIMIPYDIALTPAKIDAVHSRGGEVWTVEDHPAGLKSLLTAALVDGILTNHLDDLLDMLGSPETIKTAPKPKTSAGAKRVAQDENWEDEFTRPRG